MTCDDKTGSGECKSLALERIRYFTGRHMTARDFSDGDAYHRSMRHLHNRVLHGWGIACGLEVRLHARPECGVVIRCGMAVDCCGREVVIPKAVAQRIPWDLLAKAGDGHVLLLCLEYAEMQTEKVPVLYSTQACAGAAYEEGRIRESYRLHWHVVKEDALDGYGWQGAKGCPPPDDADGGCADEPAAPCSDNGTDCCLDPACPPHHCVALAVVRGADAAPAVDAAGRRSIEQGREHMTHICWISWPHGGLLKLSELQSLKVRFDRALSLPSGSVEPGPHGINERTFVVQYGQQREDLDFVLYAKPPRLLADKRTAEFEVLQPELEQYAGKVIHVTLRCDFIVDCQGQPVDGDHLSGRLPTGNGVPGGLFESWFRVVHDHDYDRLTQPAPSAGVKP